MKVAIKTIIEIINTMDEKDLKKRPLPNKRSIGELLEHIALICKADLHISEGASQEEMNQFYSTHHLKNLNEIKEALLTHFHNLEKVFMSFTEEELQQVTTSYWGVSYNRFEWLLEMMAHMYHHRGQLHSMLVYCYEKDLNIPLFE
jgi:uncharacterized damage-inducible protein DinB